MKSAPETSIINASDVRLSSGISAEGIPYWKHDTGKEGRGKEVSFSTLDDGEKKRRCIYYERVALLLMAGRRVGEYRMPLMLERNSNFRGIHGNLLTDRQWERTAADSGIRRDS